MRKSTSFQHPIHPPTCTGPTFPIFSPIIIVFIFVSLKTTCWFAVISLLSFINQFLPIRKRYYFSLPCYAEHLHSSPYPKFYTVFWLKSKYSKLNILGLLYTIYHCVIVNYNYTYFTHMHGFKCWICPLAFCIQKFNMISLPKKSPSVTFSASVYSHYLSEEVHLITSGIFKGPGFPLLLVHSSLAEMCSLFSCNFLSLLPVMDILLPASCPPFYFIYS